MGAVPTRLADCIGSVDPTLKRGANLGCAYGAGRGGGMMCFVEGCDGRMGSRRPYGIAVFVLVLLSSR